LGVAAGMLNVPSELATKPTIPPLLVIFGVVAFVPMTTDVVPLTVSFKVNTGVFPPEPAGYTEVTSLMAWMVGVMPIDFVAVLHKVGVCVGR
jgi:hypothetical protein